jgi:DNA adenine methylase
MTHIAKIRPAVKWHGGKAYLARRIIALLPDHHRYIEPYAGGLSVLINKPRVQFEVANDLNADLIGFYRALCERNGEFLDQIQNLQYRPETFAWASLPYAGGDPLEAAVRFLIRHRFSRGGLGRTFAWSERKRGGRPGDLNAWETFKAQLPVIASRLQGVHWRCQEAIEVIREFDRPDSLFYLDPPYPHGTRTALATYDHEMTRSDHARLIETITQVRGSVAISGYANPLYDRALSDWVRHEFDMPNHSGQGRTKERRVEVLWVKGPS